MSEEKKTVAVEEPAQEPAENPMEAVMHDPDAPVITMKKLLEAGAHFGHQTRRWNPKMKKYIYGARNGVYILDLQQSVELIAIAYKAMKEIVDNGGKVLFVGTKKQCIDAVEAEALRSGSFYITNRWLGGTLTNFKTIQGRIRFLKELERREEEGELELLPKVEAAQLRKEKEKLSKNLEGIKEMRKVPNAIFVIDPVTEHNAVAEARRLRIPVFALCDTNTNPEVADFPIPANDDVTKSVRLITAVIADAIVEHINNNVAGMEYDTELLVEAEANSAKVTIKSTDDRFNFNVTLADELMGVPVTVDAEFAAPILDAAYIKDLMHRCRGDRGFQHADCKEPWELYKGENYNIPESVDYPYCMLTLRFAVPRKAAKQRDEVVYQVLHIISINGSGGAGTDLKEMFSEFIVTNGENE